MINCNNCKKKIRDKNDINVLAFLGFKPVIMCNGCYAEKERGFSRHYLYFPRQPINSSYYFVGLIISTVILLGFLFFFIMRMIRVTTISGVNIGILIFLFLIIIAIIFWHWFLWFYAKNKIDSLK